MESSCTRSNPSDSYDSGSSHTTPTDDGTPNDLHIESKLNEKTSLSLKQPKASPIDTNHYWSKDYIGVLITIIYSTGFSTIIDYPTLVLKHEGLAVVVPLLLAYIVVSFPTVYLQFKAFLSQYINKSLPVVFHRLSYCFCAIPICLLVNELLLTTRFTFRAAEFILLLSGHAFDPIKPPLTSSHNNWTMSDALPNTGHISYKDDSVFNPKSFNGYLFLIVIILSLLFVLINSLSIKIRTTLILIVGLLMTCVLLVISTRLLCNRQWQEGIDFYMSRASFWRSLRNPTFELINLTCHQLGTIKLRMWYQAFMNCSCTIGIHSTQLSYIMSRHKFKKQILFRVIILIVTEIWVAVFIGLLARGFTGRMVLDEQIKPGGMVENIKGMSPRLFMITWFYLMCNFLIKTYTSSIALALTEYFSKIEAKLLKLLFVFLGFLMWLSGIMFQTESTRQYLEEVQLYKYFKRLLPTILAMVCFVLMLPLCFRGGEKMVSVYKISDEDVMIGLLLLHFVAIIIVYGWNRFKNDLIMSQGSKWDIGQCLFFAIAIPCPLYTIIMCILSHVTKKEQISAEIGCLMWTFGAFFIVTMFAGVVVVKRRTGLTFLETLRNRESWKPADSSFRKLMKIVLQRNVSAANE